MEEENEEENEEEELEVGKLCASSIPKCSVVAFHRAVKNYFNYTESII